LFVSVSVKRWALCVRIALAVVAVAYLANSNPHGRGKMEFWYGDVYEGDFSDGLKEGTGVYRRANGDSYVGSYKNDLKEGKGVLTCAVDGKTSLPGLYQKPVGTRNAGDVCDCVWKENKRHGACRYTFFNGEVYACTFVDGVCGEFDARQAAVRAAPDAASVQANTTAPLPYTSTPPIAPHAFDISPPPAAPFPPSNPCHHAAIIDVAHTAV
jgi:hypothetical protein